MSAVDENGDDENESPSEAVEPPQPRIPPDNPDEDDSKRYAIARSGETASLVVTARGDGISTHSSVATTISGLVQEVAEVVRGFTSGTAMLRSAVAGNSMILEFDDPTPDQSQTALPLQQTLVAAQQVAELIELEEDDLFSKALDMGAGAASYDTLASFVATHNLTLDWAPRGGAIRTLDHERAGRQHRRLSAEPEMSETKLKVNGKLYRVITIEPGSTEGSIGVHLYNWSLRPPGVPQGGKVIVYYDDVALEHQIREGLIGQPVEVEVRLRQPLPGSAIVEPFRVRRELVTIHDGPGPDSHRGISIDDIDG